MGSAFNPYQKWLGIPLKDQPAHHYRLLGVETFEADLDIIERAADRQMTYIRSLQNGDHATHAQNLLNELSAAKVCLLDAGKKQQYDQALQVVQQEQGLQPKSPPSLATSGESALLTAAPLPTASPPSAKAPPRRNAANSDSHIGSASGVGLRTAQPLEQIAPAATAAPVIAIATATNGLPSMTAHGSTATPAQQPNSGSKLPLILAAAGGVAAMLLLGGLAALLFWPSNPTTDEIVRNDTGELANGVEATDDKSRDEDTAATDSNTNTNVSTTTDPVDGVRIDDGTDDTSNGNDNHTTTVIATPRTTKGSHLVIEAAMVVGTLAAEDAVLNDRDYTFADVSPELQDLQFTRWDYGPVPEVKFNVLESGPVYLIIPPRLYAQALPNINVPGWKLTDLACTVRVSRGVVRPCLVFEREATSNSGVVPAGTAVWPMIAAAKLEKKTRILGDIASNPTPPNDEPNPVDVVDSEIPNDADTTAPVAAVVKPAKLAIPTSSEQATIRTRIVEVFELESAKTPEEKMDAAKRMLETGREPSENPVERFVLLATASRYAAEAGDLVTALQSVDEIDKSYDAKAAAMRLYLVRQFAKSRIAKNLKAQQLNYVLPVLDQGLSNDEFDAVDDAVTDLFANGLSHKELSDRRRIARDMKGKYRVVAAAKETLATNPEDGAANTVVGKYVAFNKLNWDDGLPLLAKSDVPEMQKVAQADLANPETGKEQIDIANGWYQLVEQEESEQAQGALLTRAEDWYRKAVTSVEGLDQAQAKKRLDDIQQQLVDLGWVDVEKHAVVAAASGYGCEIYHNGQEILDAGYNRVGTATVALKRGDLLMVHARKSTSSYSSYGKGFACVITIDGSTTPIVAGQSSGWNAFIPADANEWYKPEKVARTLKYVVSPNAGHTDLNQHTGVAARSIWHAAGNTGDAYFYYRVQ